MNTASEKKKVPAYIDEKNVTTDWIEDIFDNWNCTCGGEHSDYYTGFINDCVVIAQVHRNELRWQISSAFWCEDEIDSVYEELLKRLKVYDGVPNSNIECEYWELLRHDGYLVQSFYFKDND